VELRRKKLFKTFLI